MESIHPGKYKEGRARTFRNKQMCPGGSYGVGDRSINIVSVLRYWTGDYCLKYR